MSNAQDNLYIAYNNLDEYVKNLMFALTKKFPKYAEIGTEKNGDFIQINDSIIQIENEYYSSIRPKRVIGSGERPINVLKEKGIEYVEVRCMDNDPYDHLSLSHETSYFLEMYLMICFIDENKVTKKDEVIEIQTNWQNVVKDGRNPDLKIIQNGKEIPIGLAAENVFIKMEKFIDSLSENSTEMKLILQNTLDLQKAKMKDSSLTPSGKILKSIRENNSTWTEFNIELSEQHKNYFSNLHNELAYLEEEAKSSLEKFNQMEQEDEIPFADFLKNYLNAIN